MNKEMDAFFHENDEFLSELLKDYKEYKDKKNKRQNERLTILKERIINVTKNERWKIYNDYDLYFSKNIDNKNYTIGIESWYFEDEDNNPSKYFRIVFTGWSRKYWNKYGDQIKEKYIKGELIDNDTDNGKHKIRFHVDDIDGNNEDEIIEKLKECFEFIQKLN